MAGLTRGLGFNIHDLQIDALVLFSQPISFVFYYHVSAVVLFLIILLLLPLSVANHGYTLTQLGTSKNINNNG